MQLAPQRQEWRCAGDAEAFAGRAGDELTLTGSGWDVTDVTITVNGATLPATGQPGEGELRALLPAVLAAGPVVVRSRGRSSSPSAMGICVAVPEITALQVAPARDAVCPSGGDAIPGLQGDVLVVTGNHFTPADVRVRADSDVLSPSGAEPTEHSVSVVLPPRLQAGTVVVESGGQTSAPASQSICVLQPFIADLHGDPVRAASCSGQSDGGIAGYARDTLVITGGAWNADEVEVELGGSRVRPTRVAGIDPTTELRLSLPPRLSPGPVVVRSPGQDSATSSRTVCVVQPFIENVEVTPPRTGVACPGDAAALPAFAGDTLVITGGAWAADGVEVDLGGARQRPRSVTGTDATKELHVTLPAELAAGPVIIRSPDQDPAASTRSVCVVTPYISALRVEPSPAPGSCPGAPDALTARAGDTLAIAGGAWDPEDVEVQVGSFTMRPQVGGAVDAGPDGELRIKLPERLPSSAVVVRSPGRPAATSTQRICVVQPFISATRIDSPMPFVACTSPDGGVLEPGALVGLAGDTLVIEGGAWDPRTVTIELGTHRLRPLPALDGGVPLDIELRVPLPANLDATVVTVNSPQQDPATSATRVRVERPTVVALEVLPRRPELSCALPDTGALAGFADDVLMVRGCGWATDDVRVVLAERPVAPAFATTSELRLPLPDALAEGSLQVESRAQRSTASAQRACVVGPGHLRDPRAQGALEPQIAVLAAGTRPISGAGCTPADLHSGRRINADDCGPLHAPSDRVAAAFSLGAYPGLGAPVFAASAGSADDHALVELPALDAGTYRFISDIRPFDDSNAQQRPGLAIAELLTDLESDENLRLLQVDGWGNLAPMAEDRDLVGLALPDADLPDGGSTWRALRRASVTRVSSGGQLGTRVPLNGIVPGAAAVLERGWDPRTNADNVLVTVSCTDLSAPQAVTIERVTPDGGVWFNGGLSLRAPQLDCAAGGCAPAGCSAHSGGGCDAYVDLHRREAWPLPVKACADDLVCARMALTCMAGTPDCVEPTSWLRACADSAACDTEMRLAGNPQSCPGPLDCTLTTRDTGDPACVERLGCLLAKLCRDSADATPVCPIANRFVGELYPPASNGCDGSCVLAASCAADLQCRADALCALSPDNCTSVARCFERLCSGETSELVPFVRDDTSAAPAALFAIAPRSRYAEWGRSYETMCLADLRRDEIVGFPFEQPVFDVTVVPGRGGAGGTVLAIPASEPPSPELFVYRDRTRSRLSTREPYRFLRTDPVLPAVYAFPFTGDRVDVLSADGQVLETFSILGRLQDAILLPAPHDATLLVHQDSAMFVDPVGQALAAMVNSKRAVPMVDRTGIPSRLWFLEPQLPGEANLRLSGYRVGLGPLSISRAEADVVTHPLTNAPGNAYVVPVLAVGNSLALIRFLNDQWTSFVVGALDIPDPVDTGVLQPLTVRWGTFDTPGLPIASGAASKRLALIALPNALSPYYALRVMTLADGEPRFVLRTEVDGSELVRPRCGADGGVQPCARGCALPTDDGQCHVEFPLAQVVAVLPSGGLIGLFYDEERFSYELAGITPSGVYIPISAPPPFAAHSLIASPDGRRLYVGMDGAVVELELAEHEGPPWFSYRVVRTIPVLGTPDRLFLDAFGSRLLYADTGRWLMALVQ